MTLLAKALYDNLADAPDELSFRKGDIVTVIEQDVDGLMGWWLCLLHGKQGIIPGNRLKVIPPYELDEFEKDTKEKTSYGKYPGAAEESQYDFLPAPLKAGQSNPQPLSIKEMFDIPFKKSISMQQDIYDTPKGEGNELYDIPRSEINNNIDEVYDIPRSENKDLILDEDYDIPRGGNQEIYDIPKSMQSMEIYDIPPSRDNLIGNESLEIYDIPNKNNLNNIQNIEIYDTPSNNQRYKTPTKSQTLTRTQVPVYKNIDSHTPNTEIYDIPPNKKDCSISTDLEEIYDTPSNILANNNNSNVVAYDSLTRSVISVSENDVRRKFGTPKTGSSLEIDKLMGEIYDSPFNEDPTTSTIKRSPINSKTTTPRNSMNVTTPKGSTSGKQSTSGHEIYEVPRSLSDEIYDVPVKRSNDSIDMTDNQPAHSFHPQEGTQEIYDVPKSLIDNIAGLEEIYDIPNSKATRPISGDKQLVPTYANQPVSATGNTVQEIYNTPTSTLKKKKPFNFNSAAVTTEVGPQDIYDVPLARSDFIYDTPPQHVTSDEVYDVPTSSSILADREELYDVPQSAMKKPTIKELRETFINVVEPPPHEDIYDVPANHNLKKVMNDVHSTYNNRDDVGANYLTPQKSSVEDDYVDYHDVWTKEPPKELIQEHAKSITKDLSPPSPTQLRRLSDEPKRSLLEQINFDQVKELTINTTEATEQLRKLHLAVDTCVRTLLSFWGDTWLDIPNLKTTIRSIREYSGKLKTALRLLTDFGLSTLVNCTNRLNGEALMDQLLLDVEPLLEFYYKIKICLLHLDGSDWLVPDVRTSQNEKFFATLNAIMILSQRIPDLCKTFNLSVQNKVNQLFRADPNVSSIAVRRQQGRPLVIIPPKPSLRADRRSLAESLEPPVSPRHNMANRVDQLVTDYVPEDTRHRKYASDPATPSHADSHKTMWSGSCPTIIMDRRSTDASSSLQGAESVSSCSSSINASIPEETIEIKQTTTVSAVSTTPIHSRSISLPYGADPPRTPTLSLLDHRDIESLEFFCRQVESQVVLLRESMKNLTDSVENQEEPVVFVQHAKFISLTGHRVFHFGQDVSNRLINTDLKSKLKDDTSHLTVCIRGVVAATKTAALEFPNASSMMEMISSVLALGDAVRIIYSVCRKALDS